MKNQQTIHSLFEEKVKEIPQNIAVLYADENITYQALNESANQLAHYLRHQGVKKDQAVAISMERSIDVLIAILAILKAGCAYVPLDFSHPKDRLFFTLEDNDNPILIIKSPLKNKFLDYQGKLIVLDEEKDLIATFESTNPKPIATGDNLAYIIYTSGSTGKPKGVLIEHKNVINYCHWFAAYSQSKTRQRIDFSSNYIFDMAITTSIVPLTLGLTVVICHDDVKKNPQLYLQFLQEKQINLIKMTPSFFKLLLHEVKHNKLDLSNLESITLGGENLTTSDCRDWLALYPKHVLFNEYGPTEATVAVSHFKITKKNIKKLGNNIPIGKPGPNMECYILNEEHKETRKGEVGELFIGGTCLARGYLNQPELSKTSFISVPFSSSLLYKTGDLCFINKDGLLEFVERKDYQVKIRGFRIDPGEIEQHLIKHPALHNAVVLARADKQQEKRLIAYYIPKNGDAPSVKNLRDYLEQYLPNYMLPSAYVSVTEFPLTDNGKLDRQALPVPQYTVSQNFLTPSTSIEKYLANIWSQELHVKPIGISDDFFELGGHSLAAARIVSEINYTLGKALTVNDLYKYPTIETLGKEVRKTYYNKAICEENTVHKHSKKSFPLSDFQLTLWLSQLFEKKAKRLNITKRLRLKGVLDILALESAFTALLHKNPIFFYRVKRLKPQQYLRPESPFSLSKTDLTCLSTVERNLALQNSFLLLEQHYPWSKKEPLLKACYFQLASNLIELQISIPHIIADDKSLALFFQELSHFYLQFQEGKKPYAIVPDPQFKKYVFEEQDYLKRSYRKDNKFWQSYLKKAYLFSFPKNQIIHKKSKNYLYSTHIPISEKTIGHLQQFCAKNHISINNALCASVTLALQNCCNAEEQSIAINMVKSTRDNPIYDNTIGCFLRIDTLKISLVKEANLLRFAKEFQQAEIKTNLHQRFPNLVKLAFIANFQRKNPLINWLSHSLKAIFTLLFPISMPNRECIAKSAQLIQFGKSNAFLININVQNDFIPLEEIQEPTLLFGLEQESIPKIDADILKIDNFFDVYFHYDSEQNVHKLSISANLDPNFRLLIAQEIVRNLLLEEVKRE